MQRRSDLMCLFSLTKLLRMLTDPSYSWSGSKKWHHAAKAWMYVQFSSHHQSQAAHCSSQGISARSLLNVNTVSREKQKAHELMICSQQSWARAVLETGGSRRAKLGVLKTPNYIIPPKSGFGHS